MMDDPIDTSQERVDLTQENEQVPLPEPSAYQYLFQSYYGHVWRNDSREWNGSRPIETRALHSSDQMLAYGDARAAERDAVWRDAVMFELDSNGQATAIVEAAMFAIRKGE